jgi:hypothetical protein
MFVGMPVRIAGSASRPRIGLLSGPDLGTAGLIPPVGLAVGACACAEL